MFGNRVNRVRTQRDSFCCPTIAYLNDSRTCLHPVNIVFRRSSQICHWNRRDINIQVLPYGNKVPCIVKNRISILKSWSAIVENVNYLNSHELMRKVQVIHQQFQSMSTKNKHTKLYSPKVLVRAFDYFATSRSLYRKMRIDFQFPSESTLCRITSTFSKQNSGNLIANVFNTLSEKQKVCVLVHDEIYIKKCCNLTDVKYLAKRWMILYLRRKQCSVLWSIVFMEVLNFSQIWYLLLNSILNFYSNKSIRVLNLLRTQLAS